MSAPGVGPGRATRARYAVYGTIGSGGAATVHLGRLLGPYGFSRLVAVKCLHPEMAHDPEFVNGLIDETRLAACIRHPNVVAPVELLEDRGRVFAVLEYVPGDSLAHLMSAAHRAGRWFPQPVILALLLDVLRGLEAAHEARDPLGGPLCIIHRDVSPQNILVGVDGTARLLDFGVAKAVGRLSTTAHRGFKGKLAYMAPEQMQGQAVDRRADLWSAGVLLWELLAADRLFDADNGAATINRVMHERPLPPSARVPEVSSALDAVTMRALELQPESRYATATEMATALAACGACAPKEVVGRLVEDLAAESLAERRRAIAAAASEPPAFVLPDQGTARLWDGTATLPGFRPSWSEWLRWYWRPVAGVALAVMLGLSLWLGLRGHREPASASTPTEVTIRPTTPSLTGPAPDVAPTPAPPPTEAGQRTRPVKKRTSGCSPPYFISADGHKHFKPECL